MSAQRDVVVIETVARDGDNTKAETISLDLICTADSRLVGARTRARTPGQTGRLARRVDKQTGKQTPRQTRRHLLALAAATAGFDVALIRVLSLIWSMETMAHLARRWQGAVGKAPAGI